LNNLKAAFEALARSPGGDLNGFRARINNNIGAAASTLIAGINVANAEFLKRRPSAAPSPPAATVPSPAASTAPAFLSHPARAGSDATGGNLLSLVDLSRDKSTGRWTIDGDQISVAPEVH
jgi:hypothetical protein